MAVRKITEQQFRTRRKDRKMVWVDSIAVVVGLLILSASVGGVIYIEPEPEPYPYQYSFFETKIAEKHCVEDSTVVQQAGCTFMPHGKAELVPEGEPTNLDFAEVTAANVTQVTIRLSFTDQAEESTDKKTYTYENATDTIRLTVQTPWGEEVAREATNDQKFRTGEILMQFNFTEIPEEGTHPAFSMEEVYDVVIPANTVTEHEALGVWRAEVLVVRAGDQEGTLPPDACETAADPTGQPVPELPEDVAAECDLTDQHKTFEGTQVGQAAGGAGAFTSYAHDPGNGWLLDFVVRAYDVTVAF